MQQEDDLRGLEKVMQLMRGISVLFLLLHFYWFCYGWFDMHGCTLGVLDRLLRNVQRTTGLFTYSYLTKLFAAGFLALSCWGTRSVRSERITRLINKKGKLKSSIIIDELPTIYFRGLDNLIATARSNKVAVCLSFQDFS